MIFLRRRVGHALRMFLMFCLVVLAGPAFAEQAAPQAVTAGEILRGHFVQERQLAGFTRPLRSEGSFVLAPGTGLIWHGEKPFASTTVVSAAGIVQLSGNQEAMRLPASQLPGLNRLYDVLGAALSGDIAPLRQTFAVAQSAQGGHWQIALTPLRTGSVAQLKSLVLSGQRFVEDVMIDRGDGDVDHITFLDQAVSHADLTADEKSLLQTLHK